MFSIANLSILFRTAVPTIDIFTEGFASKRIDDLGDRAAAAEIASIEAAEMFGAIKDAARNGMTEEQIGLIVSNAQDVMEAKKLLLDPSATVVLDGEETTADDDPPAAMPKTEKKDGK